MDEEKNNDNGGSEDLDAMELTGETEAVPETVSETEALKEQLLRTLADFENYKKRGQKEFAQIIQNANEKLIVEILPVIDDMERALKASKEIISDDPKIQQFVQGIEIIYKKLVKALQEKGLKAMASIGTALDPNLHDALMQVDAPGQEPNTVIDEHEKGYMLYDKVIRHAKVIVSK